MTVKIDCKETAEILLAADNLLLITHRRTDGDTCGSAAALCLALRRLGKKAYVLQNWATTLRYAELVQDYLAPEGFAPSIVVTVDIADEELFSDEAFPYAGKVDICIDHHHSNTGYAKKTWVDRHAAAVGEMICALCDAMGVSMDEKIAGLVYIAISTDTGCFRFSNTTGDTLRIAARCYDAGADISEINKVYFDTKTRDRIRLEGHLYEHLQFFEDGQVALVVLRREFIDTLENAPDAMDNISSLAIQIEGVRLALTLVENRGGGCRLSARSTRGVSASGFCAQFGGGGHAAAAGAGFEEGSDTLESKLRDAAIEFIRNA